MRARKNEGKQRGRENVVVQKALWCAERMMGRGRGRGRATRNPLVRAGLVSSPIVKQPSG